MVRIEISGTWDNCSASLSKSRDAEQLPSWQNFQSTPYNHYSYIPFQCLVLWYELAHVKKVLITYATREGKPAHPPSLTRAFAVHSHNVEM